MTGPNGRVLEVLHSHRHPAGVEVRCGYGENEITLLLRDLRRSVRDLLRRSDTPTRRFALPIRGRTVDAPCVLAAIACVVDRDHIAGQVAVHVDGLDGSDASAAGTIKFWHVNSPGERAPDPRCLNGGAKANRVPDGAAGKHTTNGDCPRAVELGSL